jgi:predicted O-methyltransferase YrrM
MSAYRDKLRHNLHELSRLERVRYFGLDRLPLEPERRRFFEGCRRLPGQMWIEDRKGLYEAVLRHRPRCCFEIGTYTGGGSTYFLASAFASLGTGKVITLERDRSLYEGARSAYRRLLPHLLPHVEFLHGGSPQAFRPYIEQAGGVDCCFLDGADDATESVAQFEFFEPFFGAGALFMAHDWDTEKMRLLRPLVESRAEWQTELCLGPPASVGFIVKVLADRERGRRPGRP